MVLQRQPYGAGSERERQFINALALIYQDAATVPYHTRALNYEHAMSHLASENSKDVEAQVFYALWEFRSAKSGRCQPRRKGNRMKPQL